MVKFHVHGLCQARLLAKIISNLMQEDIALAVRASWIIMEISFCVSMDDFMKVFTIWLHNTLLFRIPEIN